MEAVVFDLDSTLADTRHRQYMLADIREGKATWEDYSLQCGMDGVIAGAVKLCQLLHMACFEIIIMTGRNDVAMEHTRLWLERHRIPYDALRMRAKGDHRPNGPWKTGIIASLEDEGYEIELVVEDYPVAAEAIRDKFPRIPVLVINPEYDKESPHQNVHGGTMEKG